MLRKFRYKSFLEAVTTPEPKGKKKKLKHYQKPRDGGSFAGAKNHGVLLRLVE